MSQPAARSRSRTDEYYIRAALREADKAERLGEVPVGAVVVRDGRIVGRGHNRVESRRSAAQHAEMIALQQASRRLRSWRLESCDLYVTLEPCAMCAGAAVGSRIRRVVYGATDPKAGACGSVLTVAGHPRLNHRPEIVPGVLGEACGARLQNFFRKLRKARTVTRSY